MSEQAAQRPIKEFRSGGIRASIWRNETDQNGQTIVRHSVRVEKRYFDPQREEWVDSEYYFVNDLPRLRLVVESAYEYITLKQGDPEARGAIADEPTEDGAIS